MADDGRLGVYLHIPFCEHNCPYCDFAVVATPRLHPKDERRYVAALVRELELRAAPFAGRRLASVYLGGGTPSLLQPESIETLLGAVATHFAGRPEEVTLEANPTSAEAGRFAAFRRAGVNRISLGVQSFQDLLLRRLGRGHRARDVEVALAAVAATGFERVSIDLMFAVPDQTLDALQRDLARVVACVPDHVSAYALSVEPETPFALAQRRGQLRLPDEARWVQMAETVARQLEDAGLRRYEVSSFSRPGAEALHNRRYWERRAVLGVGLGAWSYEPPGETAFGLRVANRRDLDGYLGCIEASSSALQDRDVLTAAAARGEAMFLGLRTREGVSAAAFAAEFGAPPRGFFRAAIDALGAAGFLVEEPAGDLRLSERGFLISDSVFEHFV